MGIFSAIKANKAYRLQQKGESEEARRLYEEAFREGVGEPRFLLAYAILLIRAGEYQRAKEFLVMHQKAPGMSKEQHTTLLVDYAACVFRLGDLDKGINTLEQQFRKTQTGLLYQTLGYLYVEKYDLAHRPDFAALKAAEASSSEGEPEEEGGEETPKEVPKAPAQTPEEAWSAGLEKAEAFLREAVDYDEDDPVCQDNMGQFLYRVKGDKAAAKAWFDRAIALKDSQIDTLYFLSLYDEEAGNRSAAAARMEKALEGRFSPLNYCTREMAEQRLAHLKGAV